MAQQKKIAETPLMKQYNALRQNTLMLYYCLGLVIFMKLLVKMQ